MIKTELTEMLGIRHPIIQAGMGPFPTNLLASAVSNVGALGLLSSSGLEVGMMVPEQRPFIGLPDEAWEKGLSSILKEMIYRVKDDTKEVGGIFGVNIMVSTELIDPAEEMIQTVINVRKEDSDLEKRLKVLVTSAGNPKLVAEMIKGSGLKWFHVAASVYHAKKAVDAGVDAVIASGHEGGMHIAWEPVHTMVLLPAVTDAVDVPVIGCGGFVDGKTLAAALALGACGIQMGTRFIATKDSDFMQIWKEQIVKAGEKDTIYGRGFVGPGRYLLNKFSLHVTDLTIKKAPGLFLHQADDLMTTDPDILAGEAIGFGNLIRGEDPEDVLWPAGESAGRINSLPTVKELVEEISGDAERIVKRLPISIENFAKPL